MVLLELLDNFAILVATRQILRSSFLTACGVPLIEYECRHYLVRKTQGLSSHIFRALHWAVSVAIREVIFAVSRLNFGGVHKLA